MHSFSSQHSGQKSGLAKRLSSRTAHKGSCVPTLWYYFQATPMQDPETLRKSANSALFSAKRQECWLSAKKTAAGASVVTQQQPGNQMGSRFYLAGMPRALRGTH